jgi:hypothetical protein
MFFASREFRIRIKRASCVRKYSKTFENIRKCSKNGVKRLKIFENIQKYSNLLSPPCAFDRAGKFIVGMDPSTRPLASLRTFASLQLAHLVARGISE